MRSCCGDVECEAAKQFRIDVRDWKEAGACRAKEICDGLTPLWNSSCAALCWTRSGESGAGPFSSVQW